MQKLSLVFGTHLSRKQLAQRIHKDGRSKHVIKFQMSSFSIVIYLQMEHVAEQKCLDLNTTSLNEKLALYDCHHSGGNQFFAFAKNGQIVTSEEYCVGIEDKAVILVICAENDKSQRWTYDEKVFLDFLLNVNNGTDSNSFSHFNT